MIPSLSDLAVFMAAALALNLTPGPDMLYCFASGLGRGRAAGVVAALGVGAGCFVHIAAAAVGLAGLLLASPLLFDAVRYAGAAYLLWLAVRIFRSAPAGLRRGEGDAVPAGLGRVFLRGLLTNVLNPKVALFFLAFLPQFVQPEQGQVAVRIILLGCLLNLSGTLVNAAVGASAGGLGRLFARNPLASRVQSWVIGTIFLGLAVRLAVASRR